jgi:hypothetical protein
LVHLSGLNDRQSVQEIMKIMNPILESTIVHSLCRQLWFLGATLALQQARHIPELTSIDGTDGA